jgi:pyruvate/2-oxoglutarate dehydrogenase complex dihydrolipoamide acyltransferase (E2) component
MEAVAKALKDFPGMNISVDGDYIIKRKHQLRNGSCCWKFNW